MSVADAILNLSGFRKLPLIRQGEAAECGLACLGMIAGYHGFKTDLSSLRRTHPVSLKGCTLRDVVEIAAALDLGSRAVRCELDELKDLRTPAILHWNLGHFVVLHSIRRGKVVIHDPAIGRVVKSLQEISKNFTGVALELAPTPRFQKRVERRAVGLASLVRLDASAWGAMMQGIALSLLLQLCVLLSPFFVQLVIDDAVLKGDLNLLVAIAGGFLFLKAFEVATAVLRGLVFQYISSVVTFDMKASLFHHLVRLPLFFFGRRHVGDIQQRFQSLQPISEFIANGAIAVLIDGILAIPILVILFLYSQVLASIVVGFVALYLVLRLGFLAISKRATGDLIVARSNESSRFLETLRAMQTLKVSASETNREGVWRNLAAETMNGIIRVGNVNIAYQAFSQAALGLSTIFVVYVAAVNAMQGAITVGVITAILAYKSQLEQRATALIEQYVAWRLLDVHLAMVGDIALHEREDGVDYRHAGAPLTGAFELSNVRFQYGRFETEVLRGVSLRLSAGEFVAVTGPSGSGKTTLLKVLTSLYQPTAGQVLFDGIPAATLGVRAIREQVSAIMQDDTLLAGTIADNIAMFDEHIDLERVVECAKLACINDEIERMPLGYRSLVGDMGSTLSGGQQQRIHLARALYRRPKILFMDEGTAHLDVATERRINERLKGLSITRVVVAHRIETVMSAERVFVLADGQLREARQPRQELPSPSKEKQGALD